jgi:hypothetical protein
MIYCLAGGRVDHCKTEITLGKTLKEAQRAYKTLLRKIDTTKLTGPQRLPKLESVASLRKDAAPLGAFIYFLWLGDELVT